MDKPLEPKAKISRTKKDIKRALIELLEHKALDAVTMSELARAAGVSRNTLYQHYGNVHEVYVDIARDLKLETTPIMSQLECYEDASEPGTLPFCQLIRTSPQYRIMSQDPRFLDTFIAEESLLERHAFYRSLVDAGYAPAVAKTLSLFQVNGCFNAAKTLTDNDALWVEARQAIDTFICGGLEACIAAKVSPRR